MKRRQAVTIACRVAAAWCALHHVTVHAQAVYRCGSDAAVRYQAQPCIDGERIDAADPRSEAQRQEAQARLQREAKLANAMNEGDAHRQAARGKQAGGASIIRQRVTLDDAKPPAPKRRAISRGKQHKAPADALSVPLNRAKPARPAPSKP